jgi:DNA helicase-2/ATP-dependent DNA helicase PcrA
MSAYQLAKELGQQSPTAEQAAVIEAPARPSLVVAGAGSGKTETMAGRVVWLVANGFVRPEQVLGLTFTRKAASELASRIRRRLGQLAARGIVDAELIRSGEPTVSTYDAYAGRIVADHALRLGLEPGQQLITQTMAWQFAVRVVETYDGEMDKVQVQPRTVTAEVLALADGMAQHGADSDQVLATCKELHELLTALPIGPRQRKALHSDLTAVVEALGARCQLLPLVEAFGAEKRRREVLDFSDQMALAARLADEFEAVGAAERTSYRAVLLDEYQDTSHAQLVFLRGLFARHGVVDGVELITAVGDPSQAIYGWRGASQGTLAAFPGHFQGADARPADVFTLGTSFRNARSVLAVANAVAEDLRDGPVSTPELVARPDAPDGVVSCALYETVADEAAAVADRISEIWHADRESAAPARSIAVLVRAWKLVPRIESALRARGVPVQILGVGGLLLEPEVVDVVATLSVLADPARGDALMRLLTGARWRIGPRDLAALGRWARRLLIGRAAGIAVPDAPNAAGEPAAPNADDAAEVEPDEVDDRSIIDALDELPPAGWLSELGHQRLRRLSGELRALRARVRQPLPDLVADVIKTMGLDVEVLARGGAAPATRANLDRLIEVAADFADTVDQFNLVAFLAYLDAAIGQERALERGDDPETIAAIPESGLGIEVSRERVQILTVHASKGLEWDVVCVPGLVLDLFPGVRPHDIKGWLTARGQLPWPLRGDREGLPVADFGDCVDQVEAVETLKAFAETTREHLTREERRLAYVAFTRARQQLIVSGFRWDDAIKPRGDSPFLLEARAAAGVSGTWTDVPDDGAVNPLRADGPASLQWPLDPMGGRRPDVEVAAELVRSALAAEPTEQGALFEFTEWDTDVTVLLRERAARVLHARLEVDLPAHLSVSQLVTLRRDADELAAQLRRPMPMAPAPLARRGTAFHGWLEHRFGAAGLLDIDELPGSADADPAPDDDLLELQQAFLASEWAHRDPVEIEVPFELEIDGLLVRGRMDAVFRDTGNVKSRDTGNVKSRDTGNVKSRETADRDFVVVDWKTGRRPSGSDARAAAVQLAAYRLAWADLAGVDPSRVRACFFYLRESATVEPAGLLDRAGLAALLREVGQRS